MWYGSGRKKVDGVEIFVFSEGDSGLWRCLWTVEGYCGYSGGQKERCLESLRVVGLLPTLPSFYTSGRMFECPPHCRHASTRASCTVVC
jgi:hypothetical protein